MSRNILMIAFHFPPMSGSSGLLRSLKFARYLRDNGWKPTVLSVHPRVYDRVDDGRLEEIPHDVEIVRAFGLDAKRHLSIRSRYPRWFAVPDRWVSWCLGAIPAGLRIIRNKKIDVIFTTYPIASAVLVGLALQRLTGKPWVADFRDPMTEENYPSDRLTRRAHRWIEGKVLRHASRAVFTTESTQRMYRELYPELLREKSVVISNGYDEADFEGLAIDRDPGRGPGRPLRLVHSGLIYPEERDPRPLLGAIRRLQDEGRLRAADVRIELRGSGFEESYRRMIEELGVGEIVHLLAPLPYRESLQDAASADAFLLMQGQSCDRQIPAKVYEYLRLGRPILALATRTGDTASLLRRTGGSTLVNLHDEEEIARVLPGFIEEVAAERHAVPQRSVVQTYSRRWQAKLLGECLDDLLRERGPAESARVNTVR